MITYHKGKNKRYWKSNLLRECSNKEQLDQIPLLLDVKDLLAQAKALDKDGHYQRVAKIFMCGNLTQQTVIDTPAF